MAAAMATAFDIWLARAKEIGKLVMVLGSAFMFTAIGIVALVLKPVVKDAVWNVSTSAYALHTSIASADDRIERKGGLADITEKTMLHIDRVAGETAITATHERDYYTQVQGRIFETLNGVDAAVKGLDAPRIGNDVHRTFVEINGDGTMANPGLVRSAEDVLQALTGTIGDLDALAKDPDIKKSITEIAGVTEQLHLTTEDLRKVADKYAKQLTAPMTKKEKVLVTLDFILRGLQVDYAIQLLKFKH